MDRSFLGAVGGAATEPRSGAGTAFLRRAPSGAIPVPDVARLEFLPTAQARGGTGRERASWGTYTAARGAWRRHYLICEAFFRRSAPSSGEEDQKSSLITSGPKSRG